MSIWNIDKINLSDSLIVDRDVIGPVGILWEWAGRWAPLAHIHPVIPALWIIACDV